MAEAGTGFLEQLKSCIVWSWTYLWTVWFFIVLFLVYILRVPLKINDNLSTGKARAAGPAALAPPPPRKVSATRAGPRLAGAGGRARARGRAGARAPDARGHPPKTRRLRWRGRAAGPAVRVGAAGGLPSPAVPRPRGGGVAPRTRLEAGPAGGDGTSALPGRSAGGRSAGDGGGRAAGAREFRRTPPRVSERGPQGSPQS